VFDACEPSGEPIAQGVAIGSVHAPAIRLNPLRGSPPTHTDNYAAGEDRVRKVSEACERDRAIGRQFLGLDLLPHDDASTSFGATSVASVQDSPDLLMLLRFRANQRIDLVKQDYWQAIGV
jgi:hypothetical protein